MRPSQKFDLHPKTHSPSELTTTSFDVVCVGSGWAGRVIAARIVKAGLTAVIIENELVGGECPYWACVPSKVLLHSPEILEAAKNVGGSRERVCGDKGVDVSATFQRRNAITQGWDDTAALVPMVEGTGAKIVRGTGKLVGERKVQVTPLHGAPVVLDARLAVALCTGSEPTFPDISGLRDADPWSPRDATSADYVPEHLIVMGAGVVGCEMATAYARYGAKVTVISPSPEILSKVDDEAGKIVRESLESMGVSFYLGTKVVSLERRAPDNIVVELSSGGHVSGTELLVAAGRNANLQRLGLDTVGVEDGGRFLKVDESLCVQTKSGRWLYAVGDINGRAPLTHTSKYQAAVATNAILAEAKGSVSGRDEDWSSSNATAERHAIPQVIFTDPVVASVGFTRKAANAKGLEFREVTAPMSGPAYSIMSDKPANSWAQWLLDDEERLIGATFVGTDAADVLHGSTIAIVGGVKLQRLMHAIPSFPTLSWVYYNLMDAAGV